MYSLMGPYKNDNLVPNAPSATGPELIAFFFIISVTTCHGVCILVIRISL